MTADFTWGHLKNLLQGLERGQKARSALYMIVLDRKAEIEETWCEAFANAVWCKELTTLTNWVYREPVNQAGC
ncbi:MAG: hypothetical protein ACOX4T_09975 [Acetivibrionales bacterium]